MSVSVIMTCHNEEAFIAQAVMSVVAQTACDRIFEIIVVNDGSSDGSGDVLKRLAAEIPKLKVIETSGLGLPAARNTAIREATGEFIAILDGDDFWTPEKIERQIGAFALSPEIGLVYSDFHDFTDPQAHDALLIPVRPYRWSEGLPLAAYFVHDAPIVPSTVVLRRAVFDTVGLFDPEVRLGEDTEMFLRVAERWRFEHVPGGFAYKRRHGANLTRRLEPLLAVAESLTGKFIERNPELARLASKRMARRLAATANDCLKHGERAKAFSYLWRGFRADPFYGRIYAYFVLALFPRQAGINMRRLLRSAMLTRGDATE